ncbi:MAG: [Clostridia bacterium]|nr:[FeFe] hydrogenase H-cluster maturation GTPase HydF [Clostridia bacterium]
MGLNDTPSANRLHIGFFGCRNAGKSSLVNAVTGQELAVVSGTPGTTTDPVTKAMELLPLGPVLIIDTPGIDDEGALGEKRIEKTRQILGKTDIAVLVVDASKGLSPADRELIDIFKEKNIPHIIAYNKCDAAQCDADGGILVSAKTGENINALKEKIGVLRPNVSERRIIGDLIEKGDIIVLVTPIDESAPKGRLILPQQQTIRDILDSGAIAIVTKETELEMTLAALKDKPKMVVTDSQVFGVVKEIIPEDMPLVSFSILMARYKGFLETAVKGIEAIDTLSDGDTVLIAEGCTHHRQCNDIGTVKIPNWLLKHTGKNLKFKTVSGNEFPQDLCGISLIIHCGGCMLNEREIETRRGRAVAAGVPFTNYGTVIAHINGILTRSLNAIT